jgi:hypothetical protein
MKGHRVSYLKTSLAALVAGATLLVASMHELAAATPFLANAYLRWVSVAAASAGAAVCLLVALGGFFALQEDAKEGAPERASGSAR